MTFTENTRRSPVLWVDPMAWAKIMVYAELSPLEVSGFGYLKRVSPVELLLASPDDVFITDQVVTAGSADVRADTLALAFDQAAQAGRESELRLQWHSHGHGDAYHSDRDMATIDGYGRSGVQWMVSLVVNKRRHHVVRLDVYTPLRVSTGLQVLPYVEGSLLHEVCAADINRHVRQVVMPPAGKWRGRRRAADTLPTVPPVLPTSTGK